MVKRKEKEKSRWRKERNKDPEYPMVKIKKKSKSPWKKDGAGEDTRREDWPHASKSRYDVLIYLEDSLDGSLADYSLKCHNMKPLHFWLFLRWLLSVLFHLGGEICAECSASDPVWASVNRCVFICDECVTIHRSLGRHVSHVKHRHKSSWNPSLLSMVKALACKFASFLVTTKRLYKRVCPSVRRSVHWWRFCFSAV